MESARHFLISILLATLLVIFGTLGYILIEGWGTLDALYMTVTTLATVGYGEVHAMSRIGQVYTIVLIFLSYLHPYNFGRSKKRTLISN